MEIYVIAGGIAYWTFAVACAAILASTSNNMKDVVTIIGVSAIWPVLAVGALILGLYRLPFKTAETIRTDLHNRRLMREFYSWLDEREKKTQ